MGFKIIQDSQMDKVNWNYKTPKPAFALGKWEAQGE